MIERNAVLENAASSLKPDEIRNLAQSLLRLADSIDQDWKGPEPARNSVFGWLSPRQKVERNIVELAKRAHLEILRRFEGRKSLPQHLLGEPGWEMLLDLFQQHAGGAQISVSSLCIAASCPPTTALRHISSLEKAGLVHRVRSQSDGRVTFIELTDKGVVAMAQALERYD